MKKFLNNIKHEADHLRLSASEKAFMRSQIFESQGQSLDQGSSRTVLTRSPYVVSLFASHQFRMVLAGVMLFVLLGSVGTASAAQSALPGDLLYAVKVSVTEPIEVALAQGATAKAQVHVALAERRVEEAQTLAEQGRLDATTTQEIEVAFDDHASQALALSGGEDRPAVAPTATRKATAPKQDEHKAAPVRATATLRAASTMTMVATTSDEVAPATVEQVAQTVATSTSELQVEAVESQGEDISASIRTQRGILDALKLHVGDHHRGEDSKGQN